MKPLLVFALLGLDYAKGALVYQENIDAGLYVPGGGEVDYLIDFNADGLMDVRVVNRDAGFDLQTLHGNARIAVIPETGGDIGSYVIPFVLGDEISLGSFGGSWLTSPNGEATLLSCRNIGCNGFWTGGTNYFGVQLTDETGNETVGWGEIEIAIPGIQGGFLRSWGYETSEGNPVIAGVIPEPGVISFFFGGIFLSFSRRRRFHEL